MKTLNHAKVNLTGVTLDSLKGNPDLFEKIGTAKKSILPNPNVVVIVQDLARNIINSTLATAYISLQTDILLQEDADTLYVRQVNAAFSMDSLYTLPVSIADFQVLTPGKSNIRFSTEFPIDKRLFSILNVKELSLKGNIAVSFTKDGELYAFDLNVKHALTDEERKSLVENAREKLLYELVGDWVKAMLP